MGEIKIIQLDIYLQVKLAPPDYMLKHMIQKRHCRFQSLFRAGIAGTKIKLYDNF